MLIKAGVDISRLNREIRRALPKIARVLYRYDTELVITSTYEGTHSEGSIHYINDAVDCRGPEMGAQECVTDIKLRLGKDYDVVYEKDHIHIEWDPKS